MWSREVPVGAGDAVSDELLLQRREHVPLQHLQPVQQLWRQMFNRKPEKHAAAVCPILSFLNPRTFVIAEAFLNHDLGTLIRSGFLCVRAQRSVT